MQFNVFSVFTGLFKSPHFVISLFFFCKIFILFSFHNVKLNEKKVESDTKTDYLMNLFNFETLEQSIYAPALKENFWIKTDAMIRKTSSLLCKGLL